MAVGIDAVQARAGMRMKAGKGFDKGTTPAAWPAPGRTPKPPAVLLATVRTAIGSWHLPKHDRFVRLPAGTRHQTYVLYREATLVSGTWKAPVCGSPYNDGTSVLWLHGGLRAIDHIGETRVYVCGSPLRGPKAVVRAVRAQCT